ncbi:DUF1989 domain-containing protein [Aureimonas populi]|uniref:DUF1989 domain-containing protein n=1 Tax=Aureimonas populi TaxID=1701758 RepID=A0ABW5CN45_9HYPH|nr:urea carboxylase-associated family protein [Aureimonas populi]
MSEQKTLIVPAGRGLAMRLAEGETVSVVNVSGTQVVDTWAFCAENLDHVMSMEHSRVENGRLSAGVGGHYLTDRREPIIEVVEDTSPGIHDTIMAACDARRYELLGCRGHHRSCADNLREAMEAIGLPLSGKVPQPLNLFMNIPVGADGSLTQGAPLGEPGDRVTLKALRNCVVAFSACPQDITPINGHSPTDVEVVLGRMRTAL